MKRPRISVDGLMLLTALLALDLWAGDGKSYKSPTHP